MKRGNCLKLRMTKFSELGYILLITSTVNVGQLHRVVVYRAECSSCGGGGGLLISNYVCASVLQCNVKNYEY